MKEYKIGDIVNAPVEAGYKFGEILKCDKDNAEVKFVDGKNRTVKCADMQHAQLQHDLLIALGFVFQDFPVRNYRKDRISLIAVNDSLRVLESDGILQISMNKATKYYYFDTVDLYNSWGKKFRNPSEAIESANSFIMLHQLKEFLDESYIEYEFNLTQ